MMVYQDKTAAEVADILAGMKPTPPSKTMVENQCLIAEKKRRREKEYALEDKKLEDGDFEGGAFDSNWSTGSRTRRDSTKGQRY